MIWLIAQMWLALLIAFCLGLFIGWWARPPRRVPSPHRKDSDPGTVRQAPLSAARPEPPRSADGPADDLTRLRGIGPHYARLLQDNGIRTFRQLAELTPEQIAWLDVKLGAGERIEREDWAGQARALLRSG
ncbi:DUF4332 domain-containing protein [Parvularcula oceani]|uniref:DUF4332 domain-containing protein n=1 Tax=Parvularcula oceani TaxID=1247963 RepID=UPI0006917CB5|nr:DUF4332 domain-containing protein [Parvularcula oceani]